MNGTPLLSALLLFVLLLFSALFSASESAITALPKSRIRLIRKGKTRRDKLLAAFLSNQQKLITTLLIGNNIVNIWASSLATALAIGIFGQEGVGVATGVMTILLLIFGEITPKTIATNHPDAVAHHTAPFIAVLWKVLLPLTLFFSAINSFFIAVFKKLFPEQDHRLTEDELRTIVDLGQKDGALEKVEHQLMNRAFDFPDTRLREIMTPRTSISAISVTADLSDVLDAFKETGYSRLPLYRDSLESIIGIVHYKDILFYSLSPDGRPDGEIPEELVRKIRFVPETQGTAEFLREMRAHNLNMAIVIDEHGMTAGLVTLDDAVTAVFGSIKDEYDSDNENPDEKIQILGKGHIRIPGDLKLTDFNTLVKTNLESDWYETIGGFILEKTDRLPEKGSSIPCGSITFIIEEVADRTIRRMSVYFEEQSI